MGTASTMAAIVEAMGLALPMSGSALPPRPNAFALLRKPGGRRSK